ncbi:MAG: hypothetical protein E6Q06_04485 [Candidatus Moraniibacteriota bacterium]|nr:MAG: hypothetical protein E6Q06_04485 [Candidatus Moranbacteria bacterium]
MSLKILILPTFIILEVILAIGYIKPNIDAILAKRNEIAVAQEMLAKVDSVIANIQSLARELSSRPEAVGFVNRFYPSALDEERVVDMLNFLAQQSGVIVTDISIVANPASRSSDDAYNEALNSGMTPEQALAHAEAAARLAPQSYTAKASVLGAYPNIKDFFSRLYQSDRIHETEEFALAERKRDSSKADEEAAEGIQENFLVGTFRAKFPYVVAQRISDPLNAPLFQTASFDWQPAERAISFVTHPLPPLESDPAGRPNPFE